MRSVVFFGCACGLLLLETQAMAQVQAWEDSTRPPGAVRRSGFTAGLSGGLTLGRVSGYPNEADKIDRREYEANTGLGLANGGALWLGGALTDWFTFGIGIVGAGVKGNGYEAVGGAYVIRLEAFPLFYSGRALQNLGIAMNFGAGSIDVRRGNKSQANGGSMSTVGLGFFYEPLRFWKMSAGPALEGLYLFSPSMQALSVTAGMRLVFYGGP